jgi:hypothetical protein
MVCIQILIEQRLSKEEIEDMEKRLLELEEGIFATKASATETKFR